MALLTQKSYQFLRTCQVPLSPNQAISHLTTLVEATTLLSLYQHFFPEAWHTSTTALLPDTNQLYSPREKEFIDLVNEQLFPLGFEDWELEERLPVIPFWTREMDWYAREIEEFEDFRQFLLSLYGAGYPLEAWDTEFGFTPPNLIEASDLDWQKLKHLCDGTPPPLGYLYDVISILDHSTGCVWIDTSFEEYCEFPWTIEAMEFLTTQWQMAQELWAKEEALGEWCSQGVEPCQAVVQLWNQAV